MSEEKEEQKEEQEVKEGKTSNDVVKSAELKHLKKLETRISVLEDMNKTLTEQNKTMEESLKTLKCVPSKTNPSKTLWDELNEFIFIPEIKKIETKVE